MEGRIWDGKRPLYKVTSQEEISLDMLNDSLLSATSISQYMFAKSHTTKQSQEKCAKNLWGEAWSYILKFLSVNLSPCSSSEVKTVHIHN